jgi:hypothetical protein
VGPGSGGDFLGAESAAPPGPWAPVDLSGTDPPPDLDRAVSVLARATILEWDYHLAAQEPDEIRGLVGWLGALTRAGIIPRGAGDSAGAPFPNSLMDLAHQYGARHLYDALCLIQGSWMPGFPFEMGDWISGYWSRAHLAVVPLPPVPGWPHKVRRLADMSLLPVIDRRFWTSPRLVTSLDVAPLVLCHAIRQPARSGRLPGERSAAEVAYGRARASMTWFEEFVLPSAAESALEDFIDRCLAGPTTFPPASPAGPSGPSAPIGPSAPAQPSPSWRPGPQGLTASAG